MYMDWGSGCLGHTDECTEPDGSFLAPVRSQFMITHLIATRKKVPIPLSRTSTNAAFIITIINEEARTDIY